jgi:hypothetical protein
MDQLTAEQAKEYRKLQAPGGEFKFTLSGSEISCWMRNLDGNETIYVAALWGESFDDAKSKGMDVPGCRFCASLAIQVGTVQICLRTKEGGEPLFPDARSIFQLPGNIRDEIYNEFNRRYELTEDELGNSLRERILTSQTK